MLNNHIKIAWRNLTRHKSNTIINLSGLAVGLACCILIALYAREELSYDRFHENSNSVVTLGVEHKQFGKMISTPYPLAAALEEEVPEVQRATRLISIQNLNLSRDGQDYITIDQMQYAETGFFDIFSFGLLYGNKEFALEAPGQIVLTKRTSQQLFGEINTVGESVYWMQEDTTMVLEISGVVDNPPQNSSITFDALVSFETFPERYRKPGSWGAYSFSTYALLNGPEARNVLDEHLDVIASSHYKNANTKFISIPLTSLHLSEMSYNSGFTGNAKYLYLFGSVALFILIIACVNYVNLSTAKVSLRAKEVGVRKTAGAGKAQLAMQFLSESVLLSFGAYLLALLLAEVAMPWFNQLFGTNITGGENMMFLIWLGIGAAGVGLLAGVYPAFYLSGFSPSLILRNNLPRGHSGAMLRKGLVVGQFGIALVLIMGSMVIYEQLRFAQSKDLGFDGEQVVAINLPTQQAWQMRHTLRDRAASHAGVAGAAVANGSPGNFNVRLSHDPETLSPDNRAKTEEGVSIAPAVVDYDFIEVLDIKLLAGRNFSREYTSDQERAYILNRKAAEELGWSPEDAVGSRFTLDNEGEVIGVIENFHIASLHRDIEPVVLQIHESGSWSVTGRLLARLHPDRIPEAMNFLEQEIAGYAPNLSFNYEFLDDKFDAMYRTERRLGQIVSLFTFIAIFVACLGLYGLAAFAAERRIKEIGIRKVMGATVTQVVALLNRDFLKLVLLGFVIAIPAAWYLMTRWLADFAYRIELGPGIFLVAGGAAIFIALLTVSWQSVKAAVANPVDSLRSE